VAEPDAVVRVGVNAPVRLFAPRYGRSQTLVVFARGPDDGGCETQLSAERRGGRENGRVRLALAQAKPMPGIARQALCEGLWRGRVAIEDGYACDFLHPCPGDSQPGPGLDATVVRFEFVVAAAPEARRHTRP
jgi:hypothetical protein